MHPNHNESCKRCKQLLSGYGLNTEVQLGRIQGHCLDHVLVAALPKGKHNMSNRGLGILDGIWWNMDTIEQLNVLLEFWKPNQTIELRDPVHRMVCCCTQNSQDHHPSWDGNMGHWIAMATGELHIQAVTSNTRDVRSSPTDISQAQT